MFNYLNKYFLIVKNKIGNKLNSIKNKNYRLCNFVLSNNDHYSQSTQSADEYVFIKINFDADRIKDLEEFQQKLLSEEYTKIEIQGIEFVRVKPIQKEIFEIKTNELRSLFKYKAGKIIVVGVVFVKKTQKTPKEIIKLAKKRLKEVWLWIMFL